MRLSIILTSLAILTLACSTSQPDLVVMKQRLEKRIAAAPEGARVGLAFEELSTGATVFINETEQMHAASTMKVPVMIEVYRQAAEGRFALTDSLPVTNRFRSIVDGSPYSINVSEDSDSTVYHLIGKRTTIYNLTYQMITVSSNLATNILIELVDAEKVMATLKTVGVEDMQVLSGVEDLKAYHRGLNNTTNAVDMMRVMSAIARNAVVSPDACKEMRKILLDQQFRNKIPAKLPEEVKVAHKTGSITRINHDCAIVYLPDGRSYSLTILTKGIDNHDESAALAAELSWMVYDAMTRY
ncbi:MAG: serine hydrolase [Fidelibacterota bacterium]|nr:MAG: serine hydrolase [Candidatus Neomarinimicrobiota bacterium]